MNKLAHQKKERFERSTKGTLSRSEIHPINSILCLNSRAQVEGIAGMHVPRPESSVQSGSSDPRRPPSAFA